MSDKQKSDQARDVKCNVSNCQYHDGRTSCLAGSIEVGPHEAKSTDDTICSTFELNKDVNSNF